MKSGEVKSKRILDQAVRNLQRFTGLNETGNPEDPSTTQLVTKQRCGFQDLGKAAEFRRKKRYVRHGTSWKKRVSGKNFFFFWGGGGRGGVEGNGEGQRVDGNGEGQRVERVSVAVAALQMEIERRPANQDESAVHFCKFKAPKICLCQKERGQRRMLLFQRDE